MRLINADALPLILVPSYMSEDIRGVLELIQKAIREAPTIDAEPVRHGEWKCVKAPKGSDFVFYQCSICGEPRWSREKYCANCGTRMEGAEE